MGSNELIPHSKANWDYSHTKVRFRLHLNCLLWFCEAGGFEEEEE